MRHVTEMCDQQLPNSLVLAENAQACFKIQRAVADKMYQFAYVVQASVVSFLLM